MTLQHVPEIDRLNPLAIRLVGMLFVLGTVAFLGSPANAQHCGSYVSRAGDEAMAAVLGLTLDAEHAPRSEGPSPAPAPDLPCDGPGCSNAPPAPGSSPAPLAPPSVEHWALNEPAGRNLSTNPHVLPPSEVLLDHAPMSWGIFHPPRRFD